MGACGRLEEMRKDRAHLSLRVLLVLWGGFGFVALAFTLFVVGFLVLPESTSVSTLVLTYIGMMLAGAAVVSGAIRYAASMLRARGEMLDRRDRLQRRLNHEVRTLLNIIVGYTELAREEANAGRSVPLGRYLGEIENTVLQLLRLSNDVLDMARLDEGKVDISHESMDLCSLIEDLKAATEPLLHKQGNRLTVECRVGTIESDYTRLYQVLLNLISNANRFTTGGDIAVNVHALGSAVAGFVDIDVKDNGPGIPSEELGQIFEPFVQTHEGDGDGSGLGLTVSREFARALGGDLFVKSAVGSGATFTLRIPVRPGETTAQGADPS